FVEDRAHLLFGERIKLLESNQRYIRYFFLLAVFKQVIVNLAGTEYHPSCLFRIYGRVVEHFLEPSLSEVVNRRGYQGMTQQRFWREHHTGLAKLPRDLPTEQVKEIGRGSQVRNDHIVLGTKLEESLGLRAAVFRSLAFVPMRQQHYESVHALPLRFSAGNELVDHYLCTIRKVAKLRLPQHERPGRCHGIAIFKTEHAVLRQQGVVDMELRLVLIEVVQGTIRFVRFGVEDVRVPMGERAANGVLSGHANGRALEEQRAIRQQFSFRPSQLAGFEERGLSVAQQFFNLFDGLESLRYGDEGLTDFLYDIGRDGRIGRHVKVFGPCP